MCYHAVENTPGYLPGSDPICFGADRGAALRYIVSKSRRLLDEYEDRAAEEPELEWAPYRLGAEGDALLYVYQGPDDLGRAFKMLAVPDDECGAEVE